MTMGRTLKQGQIVENLWMREDNPLRKCIYVKNWLVGVDSNNQVHFQQVDSLWKHKITEDTEHYHFVGYVDFVRKVKEMIEHVDMQNP